MKNTGSRLSDYYGGIGLNPVGHDISKLDALRLHMRKRQNLLERHLRLPQLFWRGARVLEFGPGSGENATALARLGARLTVVEPLDYLIDRLRANFTACGVADRIEGIHQGILESFSSNKTYDAVFAEGFIHFLDDHAAAVRRLASFMADESFLIVSVVHPAGTFVEFLKKCYLEMASASLGLRTDSERYGLARALFEPAFTRINHSRGFESWSKDCVLNPLYRPPYFLDLPEVLAALPDDITLYSSWPNYLEHDDLAWHKNIPDAKSVRADTLRAYYSRAPHFIHSIPGRADPIDADAGRRFLAMLRRCYTGLGRAIAAGGAKNLAGPLARLHSDLPAETPARTKRVIGDALRLVRAPGGTEKALVAAWNRSPLSRMWGSPGHYFVLHKTRLHGR